MHPLYTPLKIFRFADTIQTLPQASGVVRAPIHVRIKPTNVCNHHCTYCAYLVDDLQLGQDMVVKDRIPRDKMKEIADDLVEMGVKAVTFSGGGEPLLYPFLVETVERLSDGGVRVASLTNGSRLTGRVAEVFSSRATWLRVSIDGWDGESYARYRGIGPGEFDAVLANMRAFKRLGGPCHLGASIIVDRDNALHIFDLARQLAETGIDSVKVSPCIVSNDGAANNEYHAPFFDQVRAQIDRCLEELARPGFDLFDSYHRQLDTFEKTYTWCPYQQLQPVIGADLRVYACHDKAYNLTCGALGSLSEQRFSDFWRASKDTFFTIDPSRDCNHHCVAHSKNQLILEFLAAADGHADFV